MHHTNHANRGVPWLPRLSSGDDEWMGDGECRKRGLAPSDFYPSREEPQLRTKALKVCAECDERVRRLCLEFALDNHIEFGVWGGTSGRERRQLWKHRVA